MSGVAGGVADASGWMTGARAKGNGSPCESKRYSFCPREPAEITYPLSDRETTAGTFGATPLARKYQCIGGTVPPSTGATATARIGRPASPSRAAAKSPSTKRGASDETSAGAAGARAVMGSTLLARLRGARVNPLPDRGPLKAELPLPDPRDRDE